MARHIVWSAGAEADIAEIGSYLERVASLAVARGVVTKIREAAFRAVDFPYANRMIPEFQDRKRRETFAFEYRLMYRVEPTRIEVLRVVHGRRLLRNVPGSFEEPPAEYTAA
ncbi:MAG: type II toxin-antitoxin system RelE/ParE family toxin [Hyphomicrobiaceae bacterium]